MKLHCISCPNIIKHVHQLDLLKYPLYIHLWLSHIHPVLKGDIQNLPDCKGFIWKIASHLPPPCFQKLYPSYIRPMPRRIWGYQYILTLLGTTNLHKVPKKMTYFPERPLEHLWQVKSWLRTYVIIIGYGEGSPHGPHPSCFWPMPFWPSGALQYVVCHSTAFWFVSYLNFRELTPPPADQPWPSLSVGLKYRDPPQ